MADSCDHKDSTWVIPGEAIFESDVYGTPPPQPRNTKEARQIALQNLEKLLATKADIPFALYRKGLGWVGLYWGEAGAEPPKDMAELLRKWSELPEGERKGWAFRGGHGIAHVIRKRDWEGTYIRELIGQKGYDFVRRMLETLLTTRLPEHLSRTQKRVTIIEQNLKIVLEKRGVEKNEPRWILSGYEEVRGKYTLIFESTGESESIVEAVGYEPHKATQQHSYSAPEILRELPEEDAQATRGNFQREVPPTSPALRTKESRETADVGAIESQGTDVTEFSSVFSTVLSDAAVGKAVAEIRQGRRI